MGHYRPGVCTGSSKGFPCASKRLCVHACRARLIAAARPLRIAAVARVRGRAIKPGLLFVVYFIAHAREKCCADESSLR